MKPKIPIFFFSGTGNTWWVGECLAQALNQRGMTAEVVSIEQITSGVAAEIIREADVLGLGYPVYGSDAPNIMKDFIEALPNRTQMLPTMIYVTQLGWSGNGASFMRSKLKKKGYDVRWAVEFKMPNNISLDLGKLVNELFSIFKPDLQATAAKAGKLAECIVIGKKWIEGGIPILNMGWTQRIPFRWATPWITTHTWSVDEDKCSACGKCERICPVGNISMVEGLPEWHDHCSKCVRCFNYCPELAILAFKKAFNPEVFGTTPYRGPVPEFRPEQLTIKKSGKV